MDEEIGGEEKTISFLTKKTGEDEFTSYELALLSGIAALVKGG